jgi:hypothetical protein
MLSSDLRKLCLGAYAQGQPMAKKRKLPARLLKVFQDPDLLKEFKRLGGIGGKTRAKKLSAAQRSEISRKAARARWRASD